MTILSIVLTIIIFSVIILIHELGHFIAAKSCGIKVNEFAIGMGPALFKKQKGETLYAIRAFPIGGYCSMEGEDDDSDDERSFNKKSVSKKILVVVAGVIMNMILGYILLVIHTAITAPITSTKIAWFEDNAKSQSTGLEVGDEIVKVNGMRIFTVTDMSYQFQNDEDSVFDMTVIRNGEKVKLENVAFES
ncbi:MAG: site-2 protease family protein, partial [Oscillospiraceae bacterium]